MSVTYQALCSESGSGSSSGGGSSGGVVVDDCCSTSRCEGSALQSQQTHVAELVHVTGQVRSAVQLLCPIPRAHAPYLGSPVDVRLLLSRQHPAGTAAAHLQVWGPR
jgi:hypothetical protein